MRPPPLLYPHLARRAYQTKEGVHLRTRLAQRLCLHEVAAPLLAPNAPSPCVHIHLIRRNNPSPAASILSVPTATPRIGQQRDEVTIEASAPYTRNGIRTVDSTAIRRPFDAHSTANRSHSQPPINHHARDDNRNDEYCSYDIPMPSKTPYGRLNAYYFSLRMAINPHSTI